MTNKDLNTQCEEQLRNQVDSIVETIKTGKYDFDKECSDYDEACAADYTKDVLDINYVINADKSYRGARLLVAFGGPNIWIDTERQEVQGYWGGDKYVQYYSTDVLGLDDYFEEYYECC